MKFISCALVSAVALSLGGCAVVTVVDTAVSATATVVETTVDVTAGAVGGAVDLVAGDDEEETPQED